MTDAWVELVRSGVPPTPGTDAITCDNPSPNATCEIVDKVWYRGSPAVSLQAKQLQYAGNLFLQDDGSVLSDHNPVLVDFAWAMSEKWRVTDTFGGESGNWFNDVDLLAKLEKPTVSSFTLRGGTRLDAISLTLSSGETFSHGGNGGTPTTLVLGPGESLVSTTLCRGDKSGKTRIFYADFTTSAGRTVQAGQKTSDCISRTVVNGSGIVGFLGQAGDEIDQLGFVSAKMG